MLHANSTRKEYGVRCRASSAMPLRTRSRRCSPATTGPHHSPRNRSQPDSRPPRTSYGRIRRQKSTDVRGGTARCVPITSLRGKNGKSSKTDWWSRTANAGFQLKPGSGCMPDSGVGEPTLDVVLVEDSVLCIVRSPAWHLRLRLRSRRSRPDVPVHRRKFAVHS